MGKEIKGKSPILKESSVVKKNNKQSLLDKYGSRETWESNKAKLYKKGGKV